MTRHQPLVCGTAILAVALMSMATAVPSRTHAQSTGPNDRVWVAQDNTAVALKTCTKNGEPCAPGSIHSILIYTMPLVQAESEHRPHLALNTAFNDVNSYFHQVYPAPNVPASAIPTPSSSVSPASCPSETTYDNYSSSFYGGSYTVYMSYFGNEYCGGSQVSAASDRETFNGGHGIWLHGANYAYDGGTYEAHDNAGACAGLGATFSFSSPSWTKNPGGDHLNILFSSGSNCGPFDTYESDDFAWY